MDQRDGVDVFASPSVTTASGRQTSIRAVDMRAIVQNQSQSNRRWRLVLVS